MTNLIDNAEALRKKEKYKEAKDLYEKILILDNNNLIALIGLADCFYHLSSKQDYYAQKAIDISKKVIINNSNLIEPYLILSYLENDIANSREYAEKALKIEGNSAEVLCCYGTLLLREKRHDEAIKYLEKAIQLDTRLYLANYNLMVAYQSINEIGKQFNQIKTIFKLKPNLRHFFLLLSTHLVSNRLFFLLLLSIPLIYLFFENKFFFLPHIYIAGLYISGILLAMRQRNYIVIKSNLLSVTLIVIFDLIIIAISKALTVTK